MTMMWRFETAGYFTLYNLLGWLREGGFFPADPNFEIQDSQRNANGNYELLMQHTDPNQAILVLMLMDVDEIHVREVLA